MLDLPPFEPRMARPLAVQIADPLVNLLEPVRSDKEATTNAKLHGTDASGSATTAQ